jgi:hypothetical protein
MYGDWKSETMTMTNEIDNSKTAGRQDVRGDTNVKIATPRLRDGRRATYGPLLSLRPAVLADRRRAGRLCVRLRARWPMSAAALALTRMGYGS